MRLKVLEQWAIWPSLIAAGIPAAVGWGLQASSTSDWDPYASLLVCFYKGRSGMEWLILSMCRVRTHFLSMKLVSQSDLLGYALLQMTCGNIKTTFHDSTISQHQSWTLWSLPPYECLAACSLLASVVLDCADRHLSPLLSAVDITRSKSSAAAASAEMVVDILHAHTNTDNCLDCAKNLSSEYICSNVCVLCVFLVDAIEDSLLLPVAARGTTTVEIEMEWWLVIGEMLQAVLQWIVSAVRVCEILNRPLGIAARSDLRQLAHCLRRRNLLTAKLQSTSHDMRVAWKTTLPPVEGGVHYVDSFLNTICHFQRLTTCQTLEADP